MNHAKWIGYFNGNRSNRVESDWDAPMPTIPPHVLAPLIRSIEQFRLGDGGGPASLIAYNDAEFLPGDWEALQNISQSNKATDTSCVLGCGRMFYLIEC